MAVVTLNRDLEVVLRRTLVPMGATGTVRAVDENGDLVIELHGTYPDLAHRRNVVCVLRSRVTKRRC